MDVCLPGEDGADGRGRQSQAGMPADQFVSGVAAGLVEEAGVVLADAPGEAGRVQDGGAAAGGLAQPRRGALATLAAFQAAMPSRERAGEGTPRSIAV